MRRVAIFVPVLLLLASSAFAQTRFEDRRRKFSFPVPSGWKQVSKENLEENYEEVNEGIDEEPITLAAFESDPSKPRTSPVLILRWRRMKPAEMTKIYEEMEADPDAGLAEKIRKLNFASVYKIGKPHYYADKPGYRISYSWENHNLDSVREWKVWMLGQFSIVIMHFRGLDEQFKRHRKDIDAAIEGFEFVNMQRLIQEELPPPAPVPVPPSNSSGPAPLRAPDESPESPGMPSGTILAILAVLLGGGVLVVVVVMAGHGRDRGGRRPPRRGPGGPARRRR